jgi:hypothetical protein
MFRESALLRGLLVAGLCVPLALFIGYQLATPGARSSFYWIALVVCFLLLPLLIRWHHSLLLICWNLPLIIFFLPGQPSVAIVMATVSLSVSIVSRTLNKQRPFISCPSVSIPLIFLAALVLATAGLTGGIHGNAFGSSIMGASRYLGVLGAIIGYFALVAQPVPPRYAKPLAYLFFLSGTVAAFHTLIAILGPNFEFLNGLFSNSINNASDESTGMGRFIGIQRFTGLTWAAEAFCGFMIMRFGIRGIFDVHHPWRWLSFIGTFCSGLLGGYRSLFAEFFILIILQLYFEKLLRTRLFLGIVLGGILAAILIVPFTNQLPLPVQRAISFLPVKVDAAAREDAFESSSWRFEVWRRVLAEEVPKYFFLGKGYNFDSTDMYLIQLGMARGIYSAYDAFLFTSDYHNGPLTLMVPFGIFGLLAFAAFCWGAVRALYANYRYGEPDMKLINTFLLADFIMSLVVFWTYYGEFYLDLINFTGIIGLSLTLNGGVRRAGQAAMRAEVESKAEAPRLQPA